MSENKIVTLLKYTNNFAQIINKLIELFYILIYTYR